MGGMLGCNPGYTTSHLKGHLMSRTRDFLVPLLLFALTCIVPFTSTGSGQQNHEQFWHFVQTVQNILAGKDVDGSQAIIPSGARLVYGTRFESLRAVVAGEISSCSLADTSYHQVEIIAQTNPSEDAGFLALKTVQHDTTKVRVHTIMFMKDSTGQYRISIWHAGM